MDRFRARTSRLRIHTQEKALVWLVSGHLVFLAWCLGGRPVWSQWLSLGLGLAALGLALNPRNYDEATADMPPFRLYTWPRLLRFPIFWLGLAFLGYIAIQGLNPAWDYVSSGAYWWIRARPNLAWLPHGVAAPFDIAGPWRALLLFSPPWLVVCAIWIGFTRRRTLQIFFTVLAGHAAVLALFGLIQRGLGATKIFWSFQPPAAYFVASFTYKNQAGAYFNLLLGVCAGLAIWHYVRSQRRLEKSSPAGLFSFLALVIATIVLFSYSRTATLLLAVFLVLSIVYFFMRLRAEPPEMRNTGVLFFCFLILFSFIGLTGYALKFERVFNRVDDAYTHFQEDGLGIRGVVAKATFDMAKDHLAVGWGAGSYRFCFPIYQKNYAAAWNPGGQRLYWEHAHNDWLEALAEYGLIGSALLAAMLVFFATQLARAYFWENALALLTVLGLFLSLVHAWVDFPFANPAFLLTWCALLPAVVRWTAIEDAHLPP